MKLTTEIFRELINSQGNNIILPRQFTEIGNLGDNTEVESIVIPNTVKKLEDQAFSYFVGLKHVEFEEGTCLDLIGNGVFLECGNLEEIVLPEALEWSTACNMFTSCYRLERAVLNNNMTEIPIAFFSGCESLVEVILPKSLKVIQSFAFGYCHSLKSLDLTGYLVNVTICKNSFFGCLSMDQVAKVESHYVIVGKFEKTLEECINLIISLQSTADKKTYRHLGPVNNAKTFKKYRDIFLRSTNIDIFKKYDLN